MNQEFKKKVHFPLVEDKMRKVSYRYGMLDQVYFDVVCILRSYYDYYYYYCYCYYYYYYYYYYYCYCYHYCYDSYCCFCILILDYYYYYYYYYYDSILLIFFFQSQKEGGNISITNRSLFIISPQKKISMMLQYPVGVGRNFSEILRLFLLLF